MYKNILVAVDGSATSNLALTEAIALAKEQNAKIRLIHVTEELPLYMVMDAPYPPQNYRKLMRETGEAILAKCAAILREGSVAFESKYVAADSPSIRICDLINEEASHWPADLIVLGTHGRRGFNRILLGSTAEGVIRTAVKPVLIVRGK